LRSGLSSSPTTSSPSPAARTSSARASTAILQTSLIASKPELKIKVRNFGWEGDTVFEQWRDGGQSRKSRPQTPQAERRIQSERG
jgi:hypothetical protein